jgi:hypothetical protein
MRCDEEGEGVIDRIYGLEGSAFDRVAYAVEGGIVVVKSTDVLESQTSTS